LYTCSVNCAPCHEEVLGKWTYSSTIFFFCLEDGCERSASCPSRLSAVEEASGTHRIGSWVDPKAGLQAVEKRKTLSPAGNRTPAAHPIVHRYTHRAIPAPIIMIIHNFNKMLWRCPSVIFACHISIQNRDFQREVYKLLEQFKAESCLSVQFTVGEGISESGCCSVNYRAITFTPLFIIDESGYNKWNGAEIFACNDIISIKCNVMDYTIEYMHFSF
jgi:hypothetical protein